MNGLREIFAIFGIKADTKELEALDRSVTGMVSTLKDFGAVIGGAFMVSKINSFVEGQVEAATAILDTSRRLGVSVDTLYEFKEAAAQVGTSFEEVANGVRFLSKNLGEAVISGGAAGDAFRQLGVAVKDSGGKTRPILDVYADVADKISEMGDSTKETAYAMQIFGRGGVALLPLLRKGGAEFRENAEAIKGAGKSFKTEFADRADLARKAVIQMEKAVGGLKKRLAFELLPGFIATKERIADALKVITKFIDGTTILQSLLGGFKAAALISAFVKIVSLSGGVGNLVSMLAKFGWIGALVAAAVLIFDDLWGTMNGADSVTRRLIDGLFGIGATNDVVADVKDTVVILGNALLMVGDILFTVAGKVWEFFDRTLNYAQDLAGIVSAMTGQSKFNLDASDKRRAATEDRSANFSTMMRNFENAHFLGSTKAAPGSATNPVDRDALAPVTVTLACAGLVRVAKSMPLTKFTMGP